MSSAITSEMFSEVMSEIGPWKMGVWDSGFKFQTGMEFGVQISNSVGFKIQISVEEVTSGDFRVIFWDSYFKVAGIQDSNVKWVGFRIQIMSSGALEMMSEVALRRSFQT